MANEGGGLYSNLLDACPPFQIDGNFGYTAAVCNMLLQSNTGEIEVLPALPKAWSAEGYFKGLRARGCFTVDCTWRNGQATSIVLSGVPGSTAILRLGNGKSQVTIPASGTWRWQS
jgi:alpha-L-fucosidase 2